MHENLPSTTAQRVAMRRAAHQILDDPKVFDDPVALRIVGLKSAAALQADPRRSEATPLSSYLRAFMAALRWIASSPQGSAVVFDYAIDPSLLNAA